MSNKKFSEFALKGFGSIKNSVIRTTIYLAGVDETNDVNFKINYLELLADATNLGTGSSVFKEISDLKTFNFRKIKAGSNKVTVTQNSNDITIDLTPSEIAFDDLSGTVSRDDGGLGNAITTPTEDKIMYWDDASDEVTWVGIGDGLAIDSGNLKAELETPLTTKGDILISTAAGDDRLAVGTNDQVLVANSGTTSGLEWQTLDTSNIGQAKIDSGAAFGYIGAASDDGVLRTSDKLTYTDGGDFVTLSVQESNIDLSNCDNSTSGFDSLYDSGWVSFPDYVSGSNEFGIYPYTNATKPEFRVINRTVYFKGHYQIGLDSGGGTLVTDWDNTRDTKANTVATESNTGSGLTTITGTANSITTPPLFSGITYDTFGGADFSLNITRNTYAADSGGTANTSNGIRYIGASKVLFDSDTSIRFLDFSSGGESPQYSPGFNSKHFDLRRALSIHDEGDRLYDYSSYKNSFSTDGTTDLASVAAASTDYHFVDFDGSDSTTWGGTTVRLHGLFAIISDAYSLSDIEDAVNAV